MESPQEAQPAWENSSLGFIEAVHQWLWKTMSLNLLVLISFKNIELVDLSCFFFFLDNKSVEHGVYLNTIHININLIPATVFKINIFGNSLQTS